MVMPNWTNFLYNGCGGLSTYRVVHIRIALFAVKILLVIGILKKV